MTGTYGKHGNNDVVDDDVNVNLCRADYDRDIIGVGFVPIMV